MVSRQQILEYAQKAALACGAREVYLFGSYARNEANQHSDVDLLLVVQDDANLQDVAIAAYRANFPMVVSIDFIGMHRAVFLEQRSIIALEVAREGVLLYSNPQAVSPFRAAKSVFVKQFLERFDNEVVHG